MTKVLPFVEARFSPSLKEIESPESRYRKIESSEESPTQTDSLWSKCLDVAKKILVFIAKLIFFPIIALKKIFLEWSPHKLVQYGFFSAFIRAYLTQQSIFKYFCCSKNTLETRKQEMLDKGAVPIENILLTNGSFLEAMCIPAKKENPEKKTVVFVLAKHYQNCHPKQYEYLLNEGWDVVFFNPSNTTSLCMKNDLLALSEKLQANQPDGRKVAFLSYCIGAHVAAAAAAEFSQNHPENPSVSLILDRGFGDANEAVENYICLAKLSMFRNKIEADYNLRSADSAKHFNGKVLFVSPKEGKDQLMHCNGRNLTQEFYECFPSENKKWHTLPDKLDEKENKMKPASHWTSWDESTQQVAVDFLHDCFDSKPTSP